ncbi:MAG: M20 family metallopeptidase [Lachnospiraceae bacterium]
MSEQKKKRLQSLVDERKDTLLDFVSGLIKIPSENPPCDSREVNAYICEYMDEAGIPYKIDGPNEERKSIIGEIGSGDEKVFLFNGHSDVVPAGDRERWDFDPYCGTITEKEILGRGTSDMKAGLGAAIFAMGILAEEVSELPGKVRIHVVPDEETNGMDGTYWLIDHGYAENVSCVLVAEPTSSDNCEVGQRGSLATTIYSYGDAAHGSLGRYAGDNAIRNMVKCIEKIDSTLGDIEGRFKPEQMEVLRNSKEIVDIKQKKQGIQNIIDHVTVNPGTIKGGTKTNMVADYCEATLDIRVPIGIKNEEIKEKLRQIIEELGFSEKQVKLEFSWNSDSNYTDENEEIVKLCVKNAEEVWNSKVVPAYQWASSDARYYRQAGFPTIQFGPSNTAGIHSYNETVDIEDVLNAAKVYIGVLCDFFLIK